MDNKHSFYVGMTSRSCSIRPATLFRKRFQHRCFPVNILKNPYLEEYLRKAASVGGLLEFCNDTNMYERKQLYVPKCKKDSSFLALEMQVLC